MLKNGLALIFFLFANALVRAQKNYPARAAPYERPGTCQAWFICNINGFNRAIAKAQGVFLRVAGVKTTLVWVTGIRRAVRHTWKRPVVATGRYPAIGAEQHTTHLQSTASPQTA